MNAFENDVLKDDLHLGPDCVGFVPACDYAIVNAVAKTVTITDKSTTAEAEAGVTVMVKVFDVNGKSVSGKLEGTIGDSDTVVINVATLKLTKKLTIKATVITEAGCKADLGAYDIDFTNAATGSLENASVQGKRF